MAENRESGEIALFPQATLLLNNFSIFSKNLSCVGKNNILGTCHSKDFKKYCIFIFFSNMLCWRNGVFRTGQIFFCFEFMWFEVSNYYIFELFKTIFVLKPNSMKRFC